MSSERRAETAADAPRAEAAPSLGTLARHSFTYSLVPIFQRVISLVMLYFYADWLTEAQYGLSDLGDLLLGALVQLLGFNVVGAMMRHYFDHADEADRAAVVSSSTIAVAVLAWGVIAPLALFSDSIAEAVLAAEQVGVRAYDVRTVMLLVLLTVPFQLLTQCGYTYLQIHKRSGLFTTISLVKFAVELGLRIYLVGVADWGVIGFFVPVLVGEAATTLLLTGWVLWHTKLRFRWHVLAPILRYTLPLIPVGLLQLGLHYGDRKLLVLFSQEPDPLHEVGIYGMGYRLGFIVTMAMLGPFVQIFHPWIYGVKDKALQSENLARVSTYGIATMTFASLFVVAFSKQALDLMPPDKDFGLAYRVVPYIATAYVLWSVYHLSQIPLYIAKRNGPLVWINGIAVLANVALNAELVPRYGFVGAGLATLGTFALLAALGLYVGARASGMHFQYGRILGTLSAMVGTSLLAMLVDENVATTAWSGVALAVLVKAVGVSVFAGWMWFGVLDANERTQFTGWLRARLAPLRSSMKGLRHLSLVLWVAVFLVAAEVALEWRAHSRGYGTLLFSPGGLSAANSSAAAAETGFGPTDAYPFRSRVHAPEKGADTVRIWIASASYAEDRRHLAADIFPVLLEDALRERGHDVEVLNASKNAYSLAGANRVLQEIGAKWQPDLVLAYHYSNDLDELSTKLLTVTGAATPGAADEAPGTEAAEGAARTETERPWPSRVMEATTLYAQAKNQFKARLVALRMLEDEMPAVIVDALEQRVLALDATVSALGGELVLCRFACSHPSSQGGALPIDYRNNLYRYNSHLSERAWRDGVDVYNALLSRVGEREGLAVLALDERVGGDHTNYRDFTHMTASGHRAMAAALADLVEPLVEARLAARRAAEEAAR